MIAARDGVRNGRGGLVPVVTFAALGGTRQSKRRNPEEHHGYRGAFTSEVWLNAGPRTETIRQMRYISVDGAVPPVAGFEGRKGDGIGGCAGCGSLPLRTATRTITICNPRLMRPSQSDMVDPGPRAPLADAETLATLHTCANQTRRVSEGGFILVSVLVLLGLLCLLAVIFSRLSVLDIKLIDHTVRRAEAESMADGVTRLVLKHLTANPPAEGRSGLLRLDGTPASCRLGGSIATLTLTDADGLVNINLASRDLIERLLAGILDSKQDAAVMAGAIVDFRTPGDASAGGGSKQAQYDLAGLRHGPKNSPFETVGELDQVVGMTADAAMRVKPLVTVNSRTGIVNLKVASAGVVLALAGDGRGPIVDFSAADQLRSTLNLPPAFTFVPRTRSTQTTTSKAVLISADLTHADGGRFVRHVVAELAASGAIIREWGELPAVSGRVRIEAEQLPACIGGLLSLTPQ